MTDLITTDTQKKNLALGRTQGLVPVKSSRLPAQVATGVVTVAGVGLVAFGVSVWGGILAVLGALGFVGTWLMRSQPALPAPSSIVEDPYIKDVKRMLAKARFREHIDKEGEKADTLSEGMIQRWKTFEKLIVTKFEPNELTFERYWGAAQSTFLSHFENLKMVSDQLTQLSLARAEGKKSELETSVAERLALGEKTLEAFDRLSSELAKLETSGSQSTEYLDDTLKELQELASRAQKYSHSSVSKLE